MKKLILLTIQSHKVSFILFSFDGRISTFENLLEEEEINLQRVKKLAFTGMFTVHMHVGAAFSHGLPEYVYTLHVQCILRK